MSILVVGLFSLLINGNVHAQNVPTSCSLPASSQTSIVGATDGGGNQICEGSRTAFNSITISYQAQSSLTNGSGTFLRFECNLNNQGFGLCPQGSFSAQGLPLGQNTFSVRAVFSGTGADPAPPQLTWSVTGTSSTVPSANPDIGAANQAATNSAINSFQNQATAQGAAAAQQAISGAQQQQAQTAATNVGLSLNPPFKACLNTATGGANSDLAIYTIEGHGNLLKLLGNSRGQNIPVSLIIYTLPKDPTAMKNIILNVDAGNPFLRGVLVEYPGIVNLQRAINFQIDNIQTQCKSTSLIDPAQILGVRTVNPTPENPNPAVVVATPADPPFQACFQAPNTVSTTAGTTSGGTTSGSSSGTSQSITSPSGPAIVFHSSNPLSFIPSQSQSGIQTGGPSDVAKYTIRGTINTGQIPDLTSNQHTLFTIINDLAAYSPSETKTNKVFAKNNNELAASIQINPGVKGRWQAALINLEELSTICTAIPFVANPNVIGSDPNDYLPDPLRGS